MDDWMARILSRRWKKYPSLYDTLHGTVSIQHTRKKSCMSFHLSCHEMIRKYTNHQNICRQSFSIFLLFIHLQLLRELFSIYSKWLFAIKVFYKSIARTHKKAICMIYWKPQVGCMLQQCLVSTRSILVRKDHEKKVFEPKPIQLL